MFLEKCKLSVLTVIAAGYNSLRADFLKMPFLVWFFGSLVGWLAGWLAGWFVGFFVFIFGLVWCLVGWRDFFVVLFSVVKLSCIFFPAIHSHFFFWKENLLDTNSSAATVSSWGCEDEGTDIPRMSVASLKKYFVLFCQGI